MVGQELDTSSAAVAHVYRTVDSDLIYPLKYWGISMVEPFNPTKQGWQPADGGYTRYNQTAGRDWEHHAGLSRGQRAAGAASSAARISHGTGET